MKFTTIITLLFLGIATALPTATLDDAGTSLDSNDKTAPIANHDRPAITLDGTDIQSISEASVDTAITLDDADTSLDSSDATVAQRCQQASQAGLILIDCRSQTILWDVPLQLDLLVDISAVAPANTLDDDTTTTPPNNDTAVATVNTPDDTTPPLNSSDAAVGTHHDIAKSCDV
ncbi:hypothetical protein A1F99_122770 [Pyrenophora tritici-repentis]|nr:hypothetical protein A1F99_122770 [Pyrenophora tritici-repentis]KAI0569218.1 hypothetical protein Alg215_11768 [Pyrenophora tritici-repentis]